MALDANDKEFIASTVEAAVRSQVPFGLYDLAYVMASGNDYRGIKFAGAGSIGAQVRDNLRAVLTAPVLAAVLNVDEEVVAKLGAAGQTAEQVAAILRPVLGDKAAAVGALLAS